MSTETEIALLAKVKALEDDRIKFLDIVRNKIQKLEKELEVSCEMCDSRNAWYAPITNTSDVCHSLIQAKTAEANRLIERNNELESNFKDISSLSGSTKGKKLTKSEEDDLLTRAKELLFEKTKICKKQELQLEALNEQVLATKDVLDITKDMLNLRNIESDHLQSRFESMELRVKNEKDRYLLTEKKLTISKQKEAELTREYENQRNIFKELRTTYEKKIELLTKQLDAQKQKAVAEVN